MSDFWNKKNSNPALREPLPQEPQTIELDETAVAELQEESESDLLEEDELDTQLLMSDASLRLEQGRLYQMVLQNDIFADTDADPRAIKNVNREIRKYVRDRMEVMLGIKQEQVATEAIVSSPFNDLEVTVLKLLASKMSKGATEEVQQSPPVQTPTTKKDGITSISGSLRANTPPSVSKSVTKSAKVPEKTVTKITTSKPAVKKPSSAISSKTEETALQKPINEMTQEELLAYNKAAEERSKQKYAALPPNLQPHPTGQALELLYTMAASNTVIANPWRTNQ